MEYIPFKTHYSISKILNYNVCKSLIIKDKGKIVIDI